jgi:hypothetical protein
MQAKIPSAGIMNLWTVCADWSGSGGHDVCHFFFPSPGGTHTYIEFESSDLNEPYLAAFDAAGQKVMLCIEPADGDITDEIALVLNRYGPNGTHPHSSVAGISIDAEWILSGSYDGGKPVTDAQASAWLAQVQSYNPNYYLSIVHWETSHMPPTFRNSRLVFENDGCGSGSEAAFTADQKAWGSALSGGPVGVSAGYSEDWSWTSKLSDPVKTLMNDVFNNVPNATWTYWYGATVPNVYGQ